MLARSMAIFTLHSGEEIDAIQPCTRPPTPKPDRQSADALAHLPSDADLDTVGSVRSLAYDRAWWFSRFVASRYGADALRNLYVTACGPGHPDQPTAIKQALGADTPQVVAAWRAWLGA